MRRVLITRATGFLGIHVVSALGRERPGVQVIGLARGSDLRMNTLPDEVCRIAGAVERPGTWAGHPHLAGVDTIVHMAERGERSRGHHAAHVDGALAMVDLAADLGARLVFVSTSGTVGVFTGPRGWADEHSPYATRLAARWPHLQRQILAERRATRRARDLGVELVILRPPALLGPGARSGMALGVLSGVAADGGAVVVRGGLHFVDVRAVASAVIAASQCARPRPVYHLPGTHMSMRDFATRVAALAGHRPKVRTLPWRAVRPVAWAARGLAGDRSRLPDPVAVEMAGHWWGLRTRFAEELGFEAPNGDVTLSDTIDWVRTRGRAA